MAELLGTVRKALRVLDYLAEREEPVAIKQLAAELHLNISSAYHLINTLAADGYVSRDERTGSVGLGAKTARLGDAYTRSWPVEPELRALVADLGARTGESTYLAMVQQRDVVITDIVESRQQVRVHALHRGYSADLHARALGKAVLAYFEPAAVREHFAAHPPRRITPRTLVTMTAIENDLERVRRRGYGEDLEEFCEGVCCLGAPFFARDGRPAGSVSISVPSFRYRNVRGTVRDAVVATAQAATAALDTAHRRVSLG
ncbi:MAG TPA: IclR family transcriptional regulator [Candidatus Elarobacter sp.]|jgi:DNA-binding IclR family transcriptional regulator|nr:IclR family transcriptional regulator [Candidatus Elarobacter sp.]